QPDFPTPEQIVEAGRKALAFSADEVLDKVTPRTRLIIINSPANPTGGVVPRNELEERPEGAQPLRSPWPQRRSAFHVRRDKAALFQWVQAPPGDRSSRKRPEQTWRRRSV